MASQWLRIAAFEARPAIEDTVTYRNRYQLEHLLGQIAAGTAKPTYLPEFASFAPIPALLLAWVTTCCFVRDGSAVDGTNWQWSQVLNCSEWYAPEVLAYLVRRRWLVRRPRFVRHPGTGRCKEKVTLIEVASWYQPGLRLKNAWLNRCAERGLYAHWLHENGLDRPISIEDSVSTASSQKEDPDRSAIQSRIQEARACGRSRPRALSDGTCGALKESPQAATVVERRPEGAADQEGIASAVPGPREPLKASAISRYPDWEPDLALVNRAASTIEAARWLTAFSRKFGPDGSAILTILAGQAESS